MQILISFILFIAALCIAGLPKLFTKSKREVKIISGADYVTYSFINNIDKLFCSVEDVAMYGEKRLTQIIYKRKVLICVLSVVVSVAMGILINNKSLPIFVTVLALMIYFASAIGQSQLIKEKQDAFERSIVEAFPLFASTNVRASDVYDELIIRYAEKVKAPDRATAAESMKKIESSKPLLEAFEEWNRDPANDGLRRATSVVAEIIIEDRAVRRIEKAASIDKQLAAPNTLYIFSTLAIIVVVPIVSRVLAAINGG